MIIGRQYENEKVYWVGKMIIDETDALRYLIEDYCDEHDTLIDFQETRVTLTKKGKIKLDVCYLNLDNNKRYSWTERYDETYSLDEFGLIIAETMRRAMHYDVKDEYCYIFEVE